MISRAKYILQLSEDAGYTKYVPPPGAEHHPKDVSTHPLAYGGVGLSAALTGAMIYKGHKAARDATHQKIKAAGMGQEHLKAKQDLHQLRIQHAKQLGLNPSIRKKLSVQKEKVQDIENKGLERYHKGLTQ